MSERRKPTSLEMLERARRLRHNRTIPERRLWHALRDRRLRGVKFRRQVVLGAYVVDFFQSTHRLVIEIDGASHMDRGEYDCLRQTWLEGRGYHVIRVSNDEVLFELDSVLNAVLLALDRVEP
jgi:very-short-patch-repair endonuclease